MRTTKDYEAHKNHLGQNRWRVAHYWAVEAEDGVWDHHFEYGAEFSTRDEAMHRARKEFVASRLATLKRETRGTDYHIEIEVVRWALVRIDDPVYGVILDADTGDDDRYEETVRLYAEDGKWEEG